MKLSKYNSVLIIFSLLLSLWSFSNSKSTDTSADQTSNVKSTLDASFIRMETNSTSLGWKYNVKKIKNSLFNDKDAKILKNITRYTKCRVKQGVINYLKAVNNKGKKTKELQVVPINFLMTMNSISLFENQKRNSLFAKANLEEVAQLTQTYSGTNCFDILIKKKGKDNLTLLKQKWTLCGADYKKLMLTIKEFKECYNIRRGVIKGDGEKKVIVEYERSHEIMQEKKSRQHAHSILFTNTDSGPKVHSKDNKSRREKILKKTFVKKGKKFVKDPKTGKLVKVNITAQISTTDPGDVMDLFYDNTEKYYPQKNIKKAEETHIQREITNILNVMEESSLKEQKLQREMNAKLKVVQDSTKKIQKQEEEVRKSIQMKENLANIRLQHMKAHHDKFHEIKLLKAVSQKLQMMKDEELNGVKKNVNKKIKMSKQQAQTSAKSILTVVSKEERLRPYPVCASYKLKDFSDKKYIQETCTNIFGEVGKGKCSRKENFCKMCCSFHVGANHMDERFKCIDKCGKAIEGKIKKDDDKKSRKKGKKKDKLFA
jgi:hypothetical protein